MTFQNSPTLKTFDTPSPSVGVETLTQLQGTDLYDLCDAADEAIKAGGGFGWLTPPSRDVMEAYWRGVLMIPGRNLFVGRLDNVIGGSAQLIAPPRNNEAQRHAAHMTTCFVAPWARGHGLARMIAEVVEAEARRMGFSALNLDVRETQEAAIALYKTLGYDHWGTNPWYAKVDGKFVAGLYFTKRL